MEDTGPVPYIKFARRTRHIVSGTLPCTKKTASRQRLKEK